MLIWTRNNAGRSCNDTFRLYEDSFFGKLVCKESECVGSKMSKKSKRRSPRLPNRKEYRKLESIDELVSDGDWAEAGSQLREFTRANPNIVAGWDLMLEYATVSGSDHLAWQAATNLIELEPEVDLHYYNAAVSSAQMGSIFSTLHYAQTYLERFPDGPMRSKVQEIYEVASSESRRLRQEDEMAKLAPDTEALMLFEQGQMLVSMGNYAEGRRVSQMAAEKLPGAPAPLNNVSLAYAVEGDLERALDTTRQILESHPDNLHACCNLIQYLIRLGRDAEAQPVLDRLRLESPVNPDHWGKLLEAFAFAGDDAAIIEIYERARSALKKEKMGLPPLALHLAAVAHARTGKEREARRLWKDALSAQPGLELARENLRDLDLPAGQRNGPWYFPFSQWVSESWIKQLTVVIEKNTRRRSPTFERDLNRLFDKIPALKTTIGILLQRGDPDGRQFALHLASHYPVDGLREFALGPHGSDQMRLQAAEILAERGEIDTTQPVILYSRGKQQELQLMNYEVYSEPVASALPEEAQVHLEVASEALYDGKPDKALEEIEAGLGIVPDERTFLNQKSVALMNLNRTAEAEAVIHRMAELYPDYLFARCAMAQLATRKRRLDEAEEWLKPLRTRSRFHISEFRALAYAQSALLKARGEKEGADSWMQMLREMEAGDDL
jgi:tetratricopeptide (TPR) repeat protein